MKRVNSITVRVAADASWGEAVNAALERVEKAGGTVVQIVDRHCHSYDASATRKTADWTVTVLVETTDA